MKLKQDELYHLTFLCQVILDGNKRMMMPEALKSLLYIVKSLEEADLSEDVACEIRQIIEKIEEQLKTENRRMKEIDHNLTYLYPGKHSGKKS